MEVATISGMVGFCLGYLVCMFLVFLIVWGGG